MTDTPTPIELTAEIVSAYASNNKLSLSEVQALISDVYRAVGSLAEEKKDPESQLKVPAVSVRTSLKRDHLICLECGAKKKMLKRHLYVVHRLTPDQYREDYSLPASYPMTAPEHARIRAAIAKKAGLGTWPRRAGHGDAADDQPKRKASRNR